MQQVASFETDGAMVWGQDCSEAGDNDFVGGPEVLSKSISSLVWFLYWQDKYYIS